jgi:hypothetical protein
VSLELAIVIAHDTLFERSAIQELINRNSWTRKLEGVVLIEEAHPSDGHPRPHSFEPESITPIEIAVKDSSRNDVGEIIAKEAFRKWSFHEPNVV